MRLFSSSPKTHPSNIIDVDRAVLRRSNFIPVIEGAGNTLKIERPQSAKRLKIVMGGDARVTIAGGCVLGELFIYAGPGSSVTIGSHVGFTGVANLLLHEPENITIGDGCLFGGTVDLTVSDMHSIVDLETGQRINPARSIAIGPRVWIGQRSTILKGVSIGADAVIGAGSIVTRDVPANCAAAGNPARIIRRSVKWVHERL